MGLCKYINNEVKDEDDILLVELGVDHINSMLKFKKIFNLDYAIITSIGEMHLSTFKNIDNIAKEKLSISKLLKKGGKNLFTFTNRKMNLKNILILNILFMMKKN